jgi:hypothetical protein
MSDQLKLLYCLAIAKQIKESVLKREAPDVSRRASLFYLTVTLALMIDSPPEGVRHPVDFHVDLVQVPAPVISGPHPIHPLAPDL